MDRLEGTFIALVFAHLGAVLVHTVAHLALQIIPPPADTAFILGVILIAPVATLPLLRFSRVVASGLLAVVMAAAFVYGFQGHFLAPGPDHVIVTSDFWTLVFVVTGAVIGALEIAALIVAGILFSRAVRIPLESGERQA